jgi:hypothetical protein
MRRIGFVCVVLLMLSVQVCAVEQVDLTTPVAKPVQTSWRIDRIQFNLLDTPKSVVIQLLGTNGETQSVVYGATPGSVSGRTGATLLNLINNCNCTTNSMAKRLLQLLQQDGYLAAGTISGTAE